MMASWGMAGLRRMTMSDLAQPGESEGVAVNDLLGMSETELSVREVLRAGSLSARN